LSLPGIEGKVKRYDWVKLTFNDIQGKKVTKVFKGFDARIVQHEIDHLDGILFIDKAVEMRNLKD
jgi:peptide deformylase